MTLLDAYLLDFDAHNLHAGVAPLHDLDVLALPRCEPVDGVREAGVDHSPRRIEKVSLEFSVSDRLVPIVLHVAAHIGVVALEGERIHAGLHRGGV